MKGCGARISCFVAEMNAFVMYIGFVLVRRLPLRLLGESHLINVVLGLAFLQVSARV